MIPVPEISKLDMGFGNIKHLPPMSTIPDKFKNIETPQTDFISKWFFGRLKTEDMQSLVPKTGVDKGKAIMAIIAILRSYEPQHEHKEAGAAYLLSEWFEEL